MMLDPTTAKALFAIVITATQSAERLRLQLPLEVTDRGAFWLVKGTPYTDKVFKTRFCMCYIFFDKHNAQINGINCTSQIPLSKKTKADLSKIFTPDQLSAFTEAPTRFEPHANPDLLISMTSGLVPTSNAAIDYAATLLKTSSKWAQLASGDLVANEQDGLWHVALRGEPGHDLAMISRMDGKLLFGDF